MRRRLAPRGDGLSPAHIGGELDWRRLAEQHKPTSPDVIAREVRRLFGTGLTARDVAVALGLDFKFVLELIQRPDGPSHD